ncbi:AraC family transcriptional regulator [Roseobacter sp. CCS2]|uniref:AraC family transcriptional regulator n=1 Tax=Roseobacter sp. CCS2 TaxID=391593 RepID=UPI0000F4044A|nr:AraC family transcriptional regulator [Roseobacter sp. CCS2]EBA13454.1 Transcriptional Regulator, AraC family protein [Roseobacter sp. CCS2]
MDPLSDIVSMLRPHDCVAAGLDAGGHWAIRFGAHEGLKCNAIINGTCWITVEGETPVRLQQGDCAVLPHGLPFILSSKKTRQGRDAETVYAPVRHGGTATYGSGGEFFMTGARFRLDGAASKTLLRSLPALVVLRDGPTSRTIQWTLQHIADELRTPRPGGALTITHLSHVLLLQVLRDHLVGLEKNKAGWLHALADPQLCAALVALHNDPARKWTLEALASEASLSRTVFAVRFRKVAGQTPMAYLTEWRMLLAADRLRRSRTSVARIAAEVGYGSESSFGAAFQRVMGSSPRRFAQEKI